jgi:hypothetical protein
LHLALRQRLFAGEREALHGEVIVDKRGRVVADVTGNATSAERRNDAGVATPRRAACCIGGGKRMIPPNPPIRG